MKTILKIALGCGILFICTITTVILVLAYFGFIPGLSKIMGTTKPRDLGVTYTHEDYDSFSDKLNGDITPITEIVEPENSIVYSDEKISVDDSFSQEELSARLNYSQWKYMPVENVQIRINPDGSVEMSGNLALSRLSGFVAREGMGQYTMDDVSAGLKFINILKVDPPIYMKLTASVDNNNVTGAFEEIKVGTFDVPIEKLDANGVAISVFDSIVSKVPAFSAESVTFSGGEMSFKGTLPAQMSVEVSD